MKKTLAAIAALAMVSVASAATVLTLDSAALESLNGTYTDTDNVISTSGYGHYSMTLVLDAQKVLSAVTADPFTTTSIIKADAGSDIGLSIKSDSTYGTGFYGTWGDTSTLYAFWTDPTGSTESSISRLTDYLGASDATYTDIAVTYQITGVSGGGNGGARMYLTLVDTEGVETTLYGTNDSLKGSSLGDVTALYYNQDLVKYLVVDDTVLDATAAAAANKAAITASVPEPASATLSLLALAGLAARRRRK